MPIFFPGIDDSHYGRIHCSLTAVHCFDDGYVGKQPVAWKEYCGAYWLKELQESMDRCTGRHNITEKLKMPLNMIQSINQSINQLERILRQQFKYGSVIDYMVFNPISISISVISLRPVHAPMLFRSSFNQYSAKYSFQGTALLSHITVIKTMDRGVH